MRITIRVNNKYYYDVGLRGNFNSTPRLTRSFGEVHPKFLEDFIYYNGKKKIKIISYGSLKEKKEMIDKMLI